MSLQLLRHGEEHSPVVWHGMDFEQSRHLSSVELVDLALPVYAPVSDWQAFADEQLAELMLLPRGWDGPQSGPITRALASYTRSLLRSVMTPQAPLPAFVPAHGGALQLEWHERGLDIELMIYRPTDAELTVHFHDGRPSIEERVLSTNFDLLSQVLQELV
jgi:hypothetical protein